MNLPEAYWKEEERGLRLFDEARELPEVFDASARSRCQIGHARGETMDRMIAAHYLRSWPAIVTCPLCLWFDGAPVGLLVFACAPRETSIRYGTETWELARLWVDDAMPRNTETWFIAKAVKHVRAEHRQVGALVSYADPSAGHRGTIYLAANWIPDGMTDEGRKTPRKDHVAGGKRYGRRAHVPAGVATVKIERVSKARFVYRVANRPLRNTGARFGEDLSYGERDLFSEAAGM